MLVTSITCIRTFTMAATEMDANVTVTRLPTRKRTARLSSRNTLSTDVLNTGNRDSRKRSTGCRERRVVGTGDRRQRQRRKRQQANQQENGSEGGNNEGDSVQKNDESDEENAENTEHENVTNKEEVAAAAPADKDEGGSEGPAAKATNATAMAAVSAVAAAAAMLSPAAATTARLQTGTTAVATTATAAMATEPQPRATAPATPVQAMATASPSSTSAVQNTAQATTAAMMTLAVNRSEKVLAEAAREPTRGSLMPRPAGRALVLDLETTGFPLDARGRRTYAPTLAHMTRLYNDARIVSIGWRVTEVGASQHGSAQTSPTTVSESYRVVQPVGFVIPPDAAAVHGITTAKAMADGVPLGQALDELMAAVQGCSVLVAHNAPYDLSILLSEMFRSQRYRDVMHLAELQPMCTMRWGKPLYDRCLAAKTPPAAPPLSPLSPPPLRQPQQQQPNHQQQLQDPLDARMRRRFSDLRQRLLRFPLPTWKNFPKLEELYVTLTGGRRLTGAHNAAVDAAAAETCYVALMEVAEVVGWAEGRASAAGGTGTAA
ncbi:hypothetical protein Agub_g3744 [Astrephomene gubernaculifera]|uniref:Exonuclease domain-containing protein n=1 Tax=Astrephomene gubernaculifera TaxID=47775 RepID=A0AAD3DMY6_9CHLO|nr:hypothetical protein Agub_g3744 [Astrephomene gubernaculifera]